MDAVSMKALVRVEPGTYKVIPASGSVRLVHARPTIAIIQREIGADTLDTVNLRSDRGATTGVVMMVDDVGLMNELPINDIATRIYHAQCRPGTTHQIHGDVVLVNDSDFA